MKFNLKSASALMRGNFALRQLAAWGVPLAALLALPAAHAQSNYATPYAITTYAGTPYVSTGADGTGPAAQFDFPSGTAVDSSGNVYVSDEDNDTVRKITPAGVVTTLAGLAGTPGTSDGTGSAARFNNPIGICVDAAGNVFVADATNQTIRKITSAGVVTTLAGTAGVPGSMDGTGTGAQFSNPVGVAVDSSDNVYVVDQIDNTIRKITSAGVVTTIAGDAGVAGSNDGTGSVARFNSPYLITIDGSGNLYVADNKNDTVREVTQAGVVTTIAGAAKVIGHSDGTGSAANFRGPLGVAADSSGNVYVTDAGNDTIRKIASGGVVTTFAGTVDIAGSTDGTGSAGQFNNPFGICADSSGNLYVGDANNNIVRKITPGGVVTTIAGTAGAGNASGTGAAARFFDTTGVAVDSSGNAYVVDEDNDMIRKISPGGVVSTLAGSPGNSGSADGTGASAQFYFPFGVAVDASGNVFVTDAGNNTIRKITAGGVVTTVAGLALNPGYADGTGSAARFSVPIGIAVDANDNLFVAEQENQTIRKITSAGVVSTIAGLAGSTGSNDGTGSAARFNLPAGIAIDGSGNLFVADTTNDLIRKVTQAGVVTTLAGDAQNPGSADGTGSVARFFQPVGIAVDSNDNIYVSDARNDTIRLVTQAGVVTTLAGTPLHFGTTDGIGAAALFNGPEGIAVDSSGTLYIADTFNDTIRKGTLSGAPQILTQPTQQFTTPGGSATFTVTASGSSTISYQWNFNGAAISGATSSSYTVTNAQASNAGSYTVTVSDSTGSTTSAGANLSVNTGSTSARLTNISTRAQVGTGGNILIPGLFISGAGTETLLVRADGPALTQFSVSGVLAQPTLSVYNSTGTLVATNTGWGTGPNASQIPSISASVGAFALTAGSADCALIANLTAGAYTVQISGVGNTTGVALAEVYEVSATGSARLANISTRALVGTGGNILIPGFYISGSGTEELLVRADGPALTQFSVPGVLAQPTLGVYNSTGTLIASNTGWGTGTNASQIPSLSATVGAFALTAGSADSAQIVTLQPGAYTIQISGVSNTTGVALAEIYEVP
jgi:sugar lactone lactonase YvrE